MAKPGRHSRRSLGSPPAEFKQRGRSVTEGVAKTGEVSPKGTVTHTERWDGSVDVDVKPRTVRARRKDWDDGN